MANIVTQLQNKDGDNLYPLAGGMAADSITTAMLQDGAVKSQNIDWTTITNQIPWAALNFSRIGLKTLKNVDSLSNFDEGVFVPYIANGELVATINGTQRTLSGCRAYIMASLGDSAQVFAGLMFITYNSTDQSLSGRLYYRTVHGNFTSAGWREISHL